MEKGAISVGGMSSVLPLLVGGIVSFVTLGYSSTTLGVDLLLGRVPDSRGEFEGAEELELDRRVLDSAGEVEHLRLIDLNLAELGCGCLRDIFLNIISINIASGGWTSLVGMSTTASNTTFLNRFDRSRSGTMIFLIKELAFTNYLSHSATSEEIPVVECARTYFCNIGLLRELRTLDLLSMILRQSRGILSKKLPPAAEFNESWSLEFKAL
ncbi:hypothetical protein Tco_1282175 [Tanacetum coccineum]